jgi:hypothetical protein
MPQFSSAAEMRDDEPSEYPKHHPRGRRQGEAEGDRGDQSAILRLGRSRGMEPSTSNTGSSWSKKLPAIGCPTEPEIRMVGRASRARISSGIEAGSSDCRVISTHLTWLSSWPGNSQWVGRVSRQ